MVAEDMEDFSEEIQEESDDEVEETEVEEGALS